VRVKNKLSISLVSVRLNIKVKEKSEIVLSVYKHVYVLTVPHNLRLA
jgi:hypothetical protein